MDTEFSVCKTGMNRTNVTAVMQSVSHELFLKLKNAYVLLKCLYFSCTNMP